MKKINNSMNKFILAVLLGVSTLVNAQNPTYFSNEESITLAVGTTLITNVDKPVSAGTLLNEKNVSAKLYLKLDLGDDYVKIDDGGTISYSVSFEVIISGGATYAPVDPLIISNTKPEQIIAFDLLNDFNQGASGVTINIISTPANTSGPSGSLTEDYVNNNISLTATIVREYGVDVRLLSNNMAPGVLLDPPNTPVPSRRINFTWNTSGTEDFANYEVQLLRLYNTDETNPPSNAGVKAEIDWNKALRVETQSPEKSIELVIAEGSGFYVWRVRPIGNYHSGGIANQENYGLWNTSSLNQGTLVNLTSAYVSSNPHAFYLTDPDENINWIYNRVFTERNNDPSQTQGVKMSEGMSYADGLLRARQTQAANSNNNTTLITQTVSDYSGRPALTTLPVPVSPTGVGGNLSGYKVGFVQAQNQDGTSGTHLYTALDYDKIDDGVLPNDGTPGNELDDIDNILDPQKIEQSGTEFLYYNGDHVDGVADAEGYAFKRTLFKTDGTGRVSEESGVGKMHALGTVSGDGGGKTTRILFGTPSDDELIRIFGEEAPLAESVIKTLTIDPNEVVSVTYTSKEGKTIATALITSSTTNLNALDNENIQNLTANNTANQNVASNNRMISSRRIALEVDKAVTLSYGNSVSSPMAPCAGGNCELKVRFYLNDLKNGETYISDADIASSEVTPFEISSAIDFSNAANSNWGWVNLNPSGSAFAGAITSPHPTDNNATIVELEDGEYILTKEVFSANDANYLEEELIAYSELYIPIFNALADKIVTIVTPADYLAFEPWMQGLKDEIDDYYDIVELENPPQNAGDPVVLPEVITTPIQDQSDIIVNYLNMDVDITGATPYVFPPDFSVPADFMTLDPEDPTQNTMTVSSGCCGSIGLPMPKPEVCVACDGEDDSGIAVDVTIDFGQTPPLVTETPTYDLTLIQTTVNSEVSAYSYHEYNKLSFGIMDVLNTVMHHYATHATPQAYLDQELTYNGGGTAWNTINTIVEDKFIRYLKDRLIEKGYPLTQLTMDRIAAGFTFESMQYMITNMIVSRYYTGQSKLDDINGNKVQDSGELYYRAKENDDGWLVFLDAAGDIPAGFTIGGPFTNDTPIDEVTGINDGDEFNYVEEDCQKFYECWLGAVDLLNAFEMPDNSNIMDSYNDDQNDPNGAEDHADDDDSKEEGNPVVDKLNQMMDAYISWKMRRMDEDISEEALLAMVNLPKLFLECTGYYYADVLDENSDLPADYQVDLFPSAGTQINPASNATGDFWAQWCGQNHGSYTPYLVTRDDATGMPDPSQTNFFIPNWAIATKCAPLNPLCEDYTLYYPYTLKPEWMFKYFVYNSYSQDATDHYIPVLNQYQEEINSCYQDLFNPICGTIMQDYIDDPMHDGEIVTRCRGEECRYYHESWSAGQRLYFYQQITGADKCPLSCETGTPVSIEPSPITCEDKETLFGMANDELQDARNYCDNRRAEFKAEIKNELNAKCYEIVECAPVGSYQISDAQIDLMVDEVVVACKADVDDLVQVNFPNPYVVTGPFVAPYGLDPVNDFPNCIVGVCFYVDFFTNTDPAVPKTCVSTQTKTITLFENCDQLILDQINSWDFDPNIPPQTPSKPGCIPSNDKEWISCGGVTCSKRDCPHLDENGNPVTDANGNPILNTYSATHEITP